MTTAPVSLPACPLLGLCVVMAWYGKKKQMGRTQAPARRCSRAVVVARRAQALRRGEARRRREHHTKAQGPGPCCSRCSRRPGRRRAGRRRATRIWRLAAAGTALGAVRGSPHGGDGGGSGRSRHRHRRRRPADGVAPDGRVPRLVTASPGGCRRHPDQELAGAIGPAAAGRRPDERRRAARGSVSKPARSLV
jgi:hypothetical protein